MKCMIVAYGKGREIGNAGELPWRGQLPADLRRFKQLTTGNAIIMGRVTFTDDLKMRILPDRQMIVVTRQAVEFEGAFVAHDLESAYAAVLPGRDAFVIGGAQLYAQALDDVDRLYVTEVDASPPADTYFPEISRDAWREIDREHHAADDRNAYAYDFVTLDRVRR